MNFIDYLVLMGLAAAVFFSVIQIVSCKKKGESGCAHCQHKDSCNKSH